jgi:hypothetical protein
MVGLVGVLAACGGAANGIDGSSAASAPLAAATPTATGASSARDDLDGPVGPRQADPRAALRSAQTAVAAAYGAAVAHPDSKTTVARLLLWYVPGGIDHRRLAARMKNLAADGFAGRKGPKGYQVIEDVKLSADGSSGAVTICTFDDGVLYDTRLKDAGGAAVIVNDEVVSRRTVTHWVHHANVWRQTVADEITSWHGANHCPAQSLS